MNEPVPHGSGAVHGGRPAGVDRRTAGGGTDAGGVPIAGHDLRAPFALRLADAGGLLFQADTLLRVLPGRRIVAAGTSAGRRVVAKVFVGAHAGRAHAREVAGLEALRAVIATPAIVASGYVADGQVADGQGPEPRSADPRAAGHRPLVLLLEHVDGHALAAAAGDAEAEAAATASHVGGESSLFRPGASRDVERKSSDGGQPAPPALPGELARVLAALHARRCRQLDPHLGNFLRASDGRLVAVDGGAVRRVRVLTARQRRNDLALLLAQFPPAVDALAGAALAAYAGGMPAPCTAAALCARIDVARRQRLRQQLAKAWRDSSEFVALRQPGRVAIAARAHDGPALRALLADPDAAIAAGQLLKAGNSATVARVDCGGRDLVIKRFNLKGPLHRLRRALTRSRAERDWENALMLRFFGVPTAAPVAVVVERRGPLRGRGYFVAEHVAGTRVDALSGSHVLSDADAAAFARTFGRLLAARLVHGDTKATNFVLAGGGVHVLDVDALRRVRGRAAFARGWQRDCRRFVANFTADPPLAAAFARLLDALPAPDTRR
jgi:tRNA A-37 threonylcarbamoyl transferase component Bud32